LPSDARGADAILKGEPIRAVVHRVPSGVSS